MRHADDDFLEAELAAAFQDLLQCRDHRLAAIKTETLGADIFDRQKLLEAFGGGEAFEDGLLALQREIRPVSVALDALLDPEFLVRILHVHELDTDAPAIRALEDFHDLVQRGVFQAEHIENEDRPVPVIRPEAVLSGIEFRVRIGDIDIQRVEAGLEMAPDPVGADQHDGAQRIEDRAAHVLARGLGADCRRRQALARALVDDAACQRRPARSTGSGLGSRGRAIAVQGVKTGLPGLGDTAWILQVAFVQLGDIGRVGAAQEASVIKNCAHVSLQLLRHVTGDRCQTASARLAA